jgi:hypothetical protein
LFLCPCDEAVGPLKSGTLLFALVLVHVSETFLVPLESRSSPTNGWDPVLYKTKRRFLLKQITIEELGGNVVRGLSIVVKEGALSSTGTHKNLFKTNSK